MTIHGISKEIELEVEGLDKEMKDSSGNIKMGASTTTKISRKDFGLNWNAAIEAGGIMVCDGINITLDVQFTKVT